MERLGSALRAFQRVLPDGVDVRPATLRTYETATFATRQRIQGVLRPKSLADVQACLRTAQRLRVPLYPVSRGKNWAYGSRVPVSSGAWVLDLSSLRRVSAFDEELGTVRIQPGVTFRQLRTLLERKGSAWLPPVIASTEEASVLGNALERGLGLGRGGVRALQTVALEVVTARGELLRTGAAAAPGSATRDLARFGAGPSLDGLFFQSNLGVVTEATVWLERRPRFRGGVLVRASPNEFPALVKAVRDARAEGTLEGVVKITNATYELVGSYWDWSARLAPGTVPPRPARPARDEWFAHLAILGDSRAQARERMLSLRARLKGNVSLYREQPLQEAKAGNVDPYLGGHSLEGLYAAYWRAPPPMPRGMDLDLDRDRRGALFCSVAVPFRAADLLRATGIFERLCLQAGFEPAITLNAVDARSVCMVGSLFFQRAEPGEDARALALHARALRALGEKGYTPFRLGIASMDKLPRRAGDTDRVLQRLRDALDPAGILAPGRYLRARKG